MADYIYYVNPDAGAAGDGTTDSLSGTSCAYQTLNAAVTARAGTHGSGNTITYRCSGNGSDFVDSTAVDLSGHTEDSVTVEGYNGNYSGYNNGSTYDNTSYYALEVNTGSSHTLDIGGVDNVTITKLQLNNTSSSNFYYTITDSVSTTDNATVTKCRVKCDKANSAKSGGGIRLRGSNSKAAAINNNVVIGNGNTNSDNIGIEPGKGGSGAESVVANNTISTFQVGIDTFNFFYYKFRNNAIVSCANDWNFDGSEVITASNNADSNDGDTPGSNNTTCVITDATDFTAPSTGDYTVYNTGSNLYDAGTTSDAPSDDITGAARGATYDIGAFEYVSTVTSVAISDSTHSHSSDKPTLTQLHQVKVSDATHNHTADKTAVTQAHQVQVASAVHAQTAEQPTVGLAATIAVKNASHGHSVSSPSVAKLHGVLVADATHGHTADAPGVQQNCSVAVSDSQHNHAAEAPAVITFGPIEISDAAHTHSAQKPSLLQSYSLTVTPNEIVISGGSLELIYGQLIHYSLDIIPNAVTVAGQELSFNLNHSISISGNSHSHTAGTPFADSFSYWYQTDGQTFCTGLG